MPLTQLLDSGRIVYVKQTQRLTGRDSGDLYLFDLFTNFEQRLTFDEHVYAISPLGQTDEESVGLLRFRLMTAAAISFSLTLTHAVDGYLQSLPLV